MPAQKPFRLLSTLMPQKTGQVRSEMKRLSIPHVEIATFKKNFLKEVVCELRFPTLFSLAKKDLVDVVAPIKKRLPLFVEGQEVPLATSVDARHPEPVFEFLSKDRKTRFAIRTSRLTLSTTDYEDFDDFSALLHICVASTKKLIDAGFFTRVGLRYVNAIPLAEELEGWINPELVRPLVTGVYGSVSKIVQEVRGAAARSGQYSFRHGIPGDAESPAYILDFDFFEENVEFDDLHALIKDFRHDAFDFFAWAAGPLAIAEISDRVVAPNSRG